MHHRAGQPRAPRQLLAAALVALGALLLLPRGASAQGICNPFEEDCSTATTEPGGLPTTTTTTVQRSTTSTTEDAGVDDGGEDEDPDRTTTTERRRSTTTEIVTTTTFTVTTLHNILIPGDGTAGAESTTTTKPAVTTGRSGISDETLILVIVAGLGVVAVVAAVLTYRYWVATRPRVVAAPAKRTSRSAFLD